MVSFFLLAMMFYNIFNAYYLNKSHQQAQCTHKEINRFIYENYKQKWFFPQGGASLLNNRFNKASMPSSAGIGREISKFLETIEIRNERCVLE